MITSKAGEPVNIHYTIESPQNRNSGADGASRSILAMTKPAMLGVGILALGTLAVGLFGMFRVPGLEEQIKELEQEIDRLTVEIDELSVENDRYETLNQDLNATLQDLIQINEDLNETATKLENQVEILDAAVDNLTDTKNALEEEAKTLTELNLQLNETQDNLETELDRLEIVNKTWTETNQNLTASTELLSAELTTLETINDNLTTTVQDLNSSIVQLEAENERLDAVIVDLQVVNQYFDATSQNLSQDLSEVQSALQSSIELNRVNTFKGLFNVYNDATTQWSCRNDDFFGTQDFYTPTANQANSVVAQSGVAALQQVLAVIDDRMLRYMCLDIDNFDLFMTYDFNSTLTHEQARNAIPFDAIESATVSYGTNAIQYYGLPNCDEGCVVTPEEWEEASFDCTNLAAPYQWTDPRTAT
ncbi:hypothetical protein ACA910_021269 [Epithemia clementina (nom. ined.)]